MTEKSRTAKSLIKSIFTFIISVAVCVFIGYETDKYLMPGMPDWYANLFKPVFAPPAFLFSPLWIASFALMGVILFFILESDIKQREASFGATLFGFQFLFVLLWGFVFFGLHQLFIAFMCAIALFATLTSAVIQAFRFSVYAGLLLIPYFMWVTYLLYLNYGFMVLNNAVFVIMKM
jgi:tryptophan-rich sensory protein